MLLHVEGQEPVESPGAAGASATSHATGTATRPYIESMIESLRQAGDRPALRWDGADTTGSQLLAAIYRYARALESLGIARGDLVAMYAPNRPEALALRYASHLLGAASVYLSAPPEPGKRAQMLVDFRPGLIVVFPETSCPGSAADGRAVPAPTAGEADARPFVLGVC